MREAFSMLAVVLCLPVAVRAAEPEPIERAVTYLSREVPHWNKEHKCFSCHNNGDAARALLVAQTKGHKLEPAVLADTLAWLSKPQGWNDNGGEGEFNDRKLARVQFASALATAMETGALNDKAALLQAASDLALDQRDDGHWHVDDPGTVGSPATYGSTLATSRALHVLKLADARKFRAAIKKAERWLRSCQIRTTPAAAGVLLALADADDKAAEQQRSVALKHLASGQGRDGGWGPYTNSPTEVFDTAIAVLALDALTENPQRKQQLERGRQYLRDQQQKQGSWLETTRPTGSQSYAQHLSTTGWATLALLSGKN